MKTILTIIIALLAVALLFQWRSEPSVEIREVVIRDTTTVVRVDTLIVEKLVPCKVTEYRTDTLTYYVGVDTLYVPIPINKYNFKDSTYSLDVSGHNVEVERLEVYPRTITKYITNDRTVTETRNRRFGIGINAGVGYDVSSRKIAPMIGVGIQYNIWSF